MNNLQPRIMPARYAGNCRRCGGPIKVGDEISYSKETGATHPPSVKCEAKPTDSLRRDAPDPNLRPGIYEHDGEVYALRPSRVTKGRLVAYKMIVQGAKRVTQTGGEVGIRFEFAKGIVYQLKPEEQMDLARARELSALYRRCIACGAKLEASKSVRDGIGPVCGRKFRNFEREEVIHAKNVLDEDVVINNKPRRVRRAA